MPLISATAISWDRFPEADHQFPAALHHASVPSHVRTAPSNSQCHVFTYIRYLTFTAFQKTYDDTCISDNKTAPVSHTSGLTSHHPFIFHSDGLRQFAHDWSWLLLSELSYACAVFEMSYSRLTTGDSTSFASWQVASCSTSQQTQTTEATTDGYKLQHSTAPRTCAESWQPRWGDRCNLIPLRCLLHHPLAYVCKL